MFLNHIALVCSSEDNSDRFYQKLLGLNKTEPKVVPSDLCKQIFGLDNEYRLINYGNERIKFEIFLSDQKNDEIKRLNHICIEVENQEKFLSKCTEMGIEILRIPKGESLLVFVRDYDGNLFEIKEKKN